jgi:hypothetical protein
MQIADQLAPIPAFASSVPEFDHQINHRANSFLMLREQKFPKLTGIGISECRCIRACGVLFFLDFSDAIV